MNKYEVVIQFDATKAVKVMAENEDRARELALEKHPRLRLCCHCSYQLDGGDAIEVLEVSEVKE